MVTKNFFNEQVDQSEVKARIIEKYFFAWAKVIIPSAEKHGGKIGYIDLYSGPGRYKDGAASTPLLILQRAIADTKLSQMLVTIFNDEDGNNTQTLSEEIAKLNGIETLKNRPSILNVSIGKEIERQLAEIRLIPSFIFLDPWGYKGLSQRIIHAVLKDWGCDCVFFFNYNRINAAINNSNVEEHMTAFFGGDRISRLRPLLQDRKPHEREAIILEEMTATIKEPDRKYVLPFRFRRGQGRQTSHFLVFVSKHKLGYGIMKEIMASESTIADQDVPSFCYSPADRSTPLLFALSQPLDALEKSLLKKFSGKTLSMEQVFEQHNIDTPYIKRNYKAALRKLEAAGKISCEPPTEKRRKNKGVVSFADQVTIKFP